MKEPLILSWISNGVIGFPYLVTLKENFPGDHVPYHVKSHLRLPCCQHGCPDGAVDTTPSGQPNPTKDQIHDTRPKST